MKLLFILLLGLGFSQTELTTKKYVVDFNSLPISSGNSKHLSIPDLVGFNGRFIVAPYAYLEQGCDDLVYFQCEGSGGDFNFSENGIGSSDTHHSLNCSEQGAENSFGDGPILEISVINGGGSSCYNGWSDIELWITAEFPEEDTGYIEEGFEFCVSPGANLLSFPCDNPISVGASLPSGIENFIESIIGQGVATEYSPSLGWVGSLAEFDPGSGYWFKSNFSLCFEYECVED
jgi:hypothetical protein